MKISFKIEGKIKLFFSDTQNLKEFIASGPVLQEMLKKKKNSGISNMIPDRHLKKR